MSNIKQGRQRERWEWWEHLRQVVWEDLSEEVTLDQRPDGSQAVNHTDVWEKSIQDRGNSMCKDSRWDCAWHVGGTPRS